MFDPELETLTWARNEAKSWSLEFDRSLSTETRGALFRRCGCRSDAFGADAIRPLCRSGRTLLTDLESIFTDGWFFHISPRCSYGPLISNMLVRPRIYLSFPSIFY